MNTEVKAGDLSATTNRSGSKWNEGDLVDHDSVAAIFLDEDGRVLTMWHKKHEMRAAPVGKVDPGETHDEALVREMHEELGVQVAATSLIGVIENDYDRGDHTVHVKTHIYWIRVFNGKPKNMEPKKHEFLQYMSLDRIAHERDVHGYKTADVLSWLIDNWHILRPKH